MNSWTGVMASTLLAPNHYLYVHARIYPSAEPVIAFSPGRIERVVEQGKQPTPASFDVWNIGGGTMHYTLTAATADDWLVMSVGPHQHTANEPANPHDLHLQVADLPIGIYTGRVLIASAEAWNPQREIEVLLEVIEDDGVSDYYVHPQGGHIYPFASWETAAQDIQSAVDAASAGDSVWVSSGTYASGGRAGFPSGSGLTNRVVLNKAVTVTAVNGADDTIIQGAHDDQAAAENGFGDAAVRPVAMAAGARLIGFTIRDGATRAQGEVEADLRGGGVWAEDHTAEIWECFIAANAAFDQGGGIYGGTIRRSFIQANTAMGAGGGVASAAVESSLLAQNTAGTGGGAYLSTLLHATVVSNYAFEEAGGVADAVLLNSIVWDNEAPVSSNYLHATFSHSLTHPLPAGVNNLTLDPGWLASEDDYRLSADSPARNAGLWWEGVDEADDLSGLPRRIGPAPDMGAYEYPLTLSGVPGAYLREYGLPTDGSVDHEDVDGDGFTVRQEWLLGTDPTLATSAFQITEIEFGPTLEVRFELGVTNFSYRVQYTDDLSSGLWFDLEPEPVPDFTPMRIRTFAIENQRFYRIRMDLE